MKSRVHPKYKTKYRVRNWASYERALIRRGNITIWLSRAAIAAWKPEGARTRGAPVPTKNLIRTVGVTDRAVLGRRTIASVRRADVRSVEVDGRLASFGRSSGRRISLRGLQAPAIRGCGQAACRW